MKTSNEVTAIFKALIEVQPQIKNLFKGAESFGKKKYVPLEDVTAHLRDVLPSKGLSYIQLPESENSEGLTLSTRVIHTSGEWIEAAVQIPVTELQQANASQKLGASITYFRRYALCAAFGIAGDLDTDATPTQRKATLDQSRFIKALQTIKDGKYTAEKLRATYQLNDEQEGQLEELKNEN
jgi:hypothetical protein